jgi:hypothetical protein
MIVIRGRALATVDAGDTVIYDGAAAVEADPINFHTRCPYAEARCRIEVPQLRELKPGHFAACHLAPARPQCPPAA